VQQNKLVEPTDPNDEDYVEPIAQAVQHDFVDASSLWTDNSFSAIQAQPLPQSPTVPLWLGQGFTALA
jgi:hypothetical protein